MSCARYLAQEIVQGQWHLQGDSGAEGSSEVWSPPSASAEQRLELIVRDGLDG